MKPKLLFTISLIMLTAISPLSIFLPLSCGQTSTNVGGLISADTTWTKNGSPYNLTGPLGVKQDVTLTIEAGTTVNLGYYYMQINGSLIAKGTETSEIRFNGGSSQGITFTDQCSDWNEQTESGCIIQYATIIPKLIVSDAAIKIDHCSVLGVFSVEGSNIVTNNIISGGIEVVGAAVISGNRISGTASAAPSANQPVVSVISESNPNQIATITNNVIQGGNPMFGHKQDTGISCYGYAAITNNTITHCEEAIRVHPPKASSYPLIEKNTIYNNLYGILIRAASNPTLSDAPIIEANLITNNTAGIYVENHGGAIAPVIKNNNLFDNSLNFLLGTATDLAIPSNYWGTTNETVISQSIYDSKNDFNLGTVTFQPYLTVPNPVAPQAIPAATQTPSPSPTIPEFSTITLAISIILSTTAAALYRKNPAKTKK